MGFAWWSQVATGWRAARRRRRAPGRSALGVEALGERVLLSGLTAAAAEHGLVRDLLAGLRDQAPGGGTAGLVVVLGGAQAGARPSPGPVFEFDFRPGAGVQVSPVAAPASPGGGTPDRTYLVLIPSDELPKSAEVVARLEQEATHTFFDPSGRALVLEMPRPPFRPDDRNGAALRLELVTLGPSALVPKEPSPAPRGEEGPAETAQAPGDERSVAGLAGPQLPQARANASQELPDAQAADAETDGLAEWAAPESAGPTLPPGPSAGPAGVELVPLGNNSLSAVPALLAPPAGEAGATEGAARADSEPGPASPDVTAVPAQVQTHPAGLPPVGASPLPGSESPWLSELLLRLAEEREAHSLPGPVLDALFIVGWWEVSQERWRNQAPTARGSSPWREPLASGGRQPLPVRSTGD